MFDELLIDHCAPTLSGLKIANMFTCTYFSQNELYDKILLWNSLLNSRRIFLKVLRYESFRAIVYVYRKNNLEEVLSNIDISNFLYNYGYKSSKISYSINLLRKRMVLNCNFPHEIGIFLGYPLKDVNSFIKNSGKNCLYAGYWKVYHNKNEAIKMFNNFTKCRLLYRNLFLGGKSVFQLMDNFA